MPFGAIGGAFGSLASSALNLWEGRQNRKFQADMSNTAYQRQVRDMKAAGLNPILAAMKGGGASTPSGAMGQVTDPTTSALGGYKAKAEKKSIQATTDKTVTDAKTSAEHAKQEKFNTSIEKEQHDYLTKTPDGRAVLRAGAGAKMGVHPAVGGASGIINEIVNSDVLDKPREAVVNSANKLDNMVKGKDPNVVLLDKLPVKSKNSRVKPADTSKIIRMNIK